MEEFWSGVEEQGLYTEEIMETNWLEGSHELSTSGGWEEGTYGKSWGESILVWETKEEES